MGDEMKYSEGQRNQIYEKYLRPLKLKISQILLYDTNAAAVLEIFFSSAICSIN